jgi:hypothetical protein
MTALEKGDRVVERAAERLRSTAQRLAAEGGTKAKLAETLAEDAEFVRRLKPSLIRARFKGEAPTDGAPPTDGDPGARAGLTTFGATPPSGPGRGGPSPVVVVAAAFAAGILLAKVIDWRSHAHPRL